MLDTISFFAPKLRLDTRVLVWKGTWGSSQIVAVAITLGTILQIGSVQPKTQLQGSPDKWLSRTVGLLEQLAPFPALRGRMSHLLSIVCRMGAAAVLRVLQMAEDLLVPMLHGMKKRHSCLIHR